jgi:hypothetical protein
MTTDMLTNNIPSERQRTIVGSVIYNILGSLLNLITDILNVSWQPAGQLDDFFLQPLDGQKLLSPVDNKIELATNQTYFASIGTRTAIGSQPWVPQKVPSLYSALTTGDAALDPATYGPGSNPWVVKSGQVVQIHYQNTHPYPHPMHLHVSNHRSLRFHSKLTALGSRLPGRRSWFRSLERRRELSAQHTSQARRLCSSRQRLHCHPLQSRQSRCLVLPLPYRFAFGRWHGSDDHRST